MRQKYNVNSLLHSANRFPSYLHNLTISDRQDEKLKKCRSLVRSTLREGFAMLRDNKHRFSNDVDDYISQLKPKFWTQGSYVYKTLNLPAYTPPQQIDLDDGVYFPMDVVEDQPKAAKQVIFDLVDKMLQDLAKAQGWTFDNQKNTCARLIVDDTIHIDIPIYAIPSERYRKLIEERDQQKSFVQNLDQSAEIRLDPKEVYLALRDEEHWKKSDPMKLHDWFKNECLLHSRLRRICRYIKSWRDFTWKSGGPSSITLMVAAAETFDKHLGEKGKSFGSDCEALLAVVRALITQFNGQILNPVEEGEVMFPRNQAPDQIFDIRDKLKSLKQGVEYALCEVTSKQDVVNTLIAIFGDRFPSQPEAVELISVADSVRSGVAINQRPPAPPESMRSA